MMRAGRGCACMVGGLRGMLGGGHDGQEGSLRSPAERGSSLHHMAWNECDTRGVAMHARRREVEGGGERWREEES